MKRETHCFSGFGKKQPPLVCRFPSPRLVRQQADRVAADPDGIAAHLSLRSFGDQTARSGRVVDGSPNGWPRLKRKATTGTNTGSADYGVMWRGGLSMPPLLTSDPVHVMLLEYPVKRFFHYLLNGLVGLR